MSAWPAAGVVLLLLVWPVISDHFIPAPLVQRLITVIVGLSPVGLLMGMPFPLGLRAVDSWGDRHVALAWAVNGVASVAGSAGGVALAITGSFGPVILVGALAYESAALIVHILAGQQHRE